MLRHQNAGGLARVFKPSLTMTTLCCTRKLHHDRSFMLVKVIDSEDKVSSSKGDILMVAEKVVFSNYR